MQTSADVALTAGGNILDATGNVDGQAGTTNVSANGLRLNAGGNVGTPTDALRTHVAIVSDASADLNLVNDQGLSIGGVAVAVGQVNADGSVGTVADALQQGIASSGNVALQSTSGNLVLNQAVTASGNVVMQAANGSLTVSAAVHAGANIGLQASGGDVVVDQAVTASGSGNVLMRSVTGLANVNANVQDGSGDVSIVGATGVDIGNAITVSTGGSGSLDVESGAGSVAMSAGSVLSGNGAVRVIAAQDIGLAHIQTSGNVALTATAGSITNATGASNNVSAAGLIVKAGTGIAVGNNPLLTHIDMLSAVAGNGGLYVLNDQGLRTGGVSVGVGQVGIDGQLTLAVDATVASAITASGNVVLRALLGNINIDPNGLSSAIDATGAGNVLVRALSGSVVVHSNITNGSAATSGSISLLATGDVAIGSAGVEVTVSNGAGSLDVESSTGSVLMSAGSLLASASGAVRLLAAQDVGVGQIRSGGNVALTATAGSVLDANGNVNGSASGLLDVQASGLRLSAGNGVGTSGDALRVQVATASADAGAGGIYLLSDQAITIGSVAVGASQVSSTGATSLVADAAQAGLATTGNGNVALSASAGDITLAAAVNANGSGNVLLQSQVGAVDANAGIASGNGNISVQGATHVALAAGVSVATGAGTLDLESSGGWVAMDGTSVLQSVSGNVRVSAASDIDVGLVQTGANVSLSAATGSIYDARGNGALNVVANGLRLSASDAIGQSADALRTQVAIVSANAGASGVFLANDQNELVAGVSVVVKQLGLSGDTREVTDATQYGVVTRANGNIVLTSSAGDIALAPGLASNTAISADGSGNVLVQTLGGDVLVGANIASGSGNITLLGARGVNVGSYGLSESIATSGSLDIEAGSGSVAMSAYSSLQAGAGVRVLAAQDIALGSVQTAGNVSLTATAGSIYDNNGNANGGSTIVIDVQASALRLSAGTGIGNGFDALQIQVGTVTARTGAGGAYLASDQAITVGSVSASVAKVGADGSTATVSDAAQAGLASASNGNLVLQASAGDVTLASAVAADGSGNVLLQAVGGAVGVGSNVSSASGAISVLGATFVNLDATVASAGALDIEAAAGSVTMGLGSLLSSSGASVRVVAGQDIAIARIVGADVALTAAGSIVDANGNVNGQTGIVDVSANNLRLSAGASVGSASDALRLHVSTLGASSANAWLVDDQAIDVGTVSVTTQQTGLDGNVTDVVDAAQSGLRETGFAVLLAGGDVTVDQAVTAGANVLIQSAGGAIHLNAHVLETGAGSVSLLATGDVDIGGPSTAIAVTTLGGTLDVESASGSVRMSGGSVLASVSGDVRVKAAGDVALSLVQTSGNVALTATTGDILNESFTGENIIAAGLVLNAGGGAGQWFDALQTQVSTLAIAAGTGVYLVNDQALHLAGVSASVQQVGLDGGSTAATDALAGAAVTSGGNVALEVSSGDLAVDGALTAAGNVLLQAHNGALGIHATVQASGNGAVTLLATGRIGLTAGAVPGIVIASVIAADSASDSLVMEAGTSLDATGSIRVAVAKDITLGQVSAGGNVALTAATGSITGTGAALDVTASALRLEAGGGVTLNVHVGSVTAHAGSGGVTLASDQSVTVGSVSVDTVQVDDTGATSLVTDALQSGIVTTGNGHVTLTASAGDITLTSASSSVAAISADGSGDVLVQTTSTLGNIIALGNVTSGSGDISLLGGNNVVLYTQASGVALISTGLPGLVGVHAANGTVVSGGTTQPGQTVSLNTDQLTLVAPLVGTGNQLDISPATVAGTPAPVTIGGTAANGSGSLYLSQDQTALIQSGFKDVQIGSTMPGQQVDVVGQDANGNASTNVFVNPLTLLASGAGATVSISGGLTATSLEIQGSGTGTTLASAALSTRGALQIDDNVFVSGSTMLSSGTGGASNIVINGAVTGSGAGSSLSFSAGGGNVVVAGAVSGIGALNVTHSTALTFESSLSVTGNVVINATGTVNFEGGVTIAAGGSLTIIGASQVTFAGQANFTQAGNVTISANALNFNGGAGSVTGAGVLTLAAATPAGAIHVGGTAMNGALNIGATSINAIAAGFQQVVLGTLDAATGHVAAGAGAIDLSGDANLSAFAAPVSVYASTITVDAGGAGLQVGGALTLDAAGLIQVSSSVSTTTAADVTLTSATGAVTMAAQTHIATQGGDVTITGGHSSNVTVSTIDTRVAGSSVAGLVSIDAQAGRVINANANSSVNVYAAAVSMNGYGALQGNTGTTSSVLKVSAPVVQVTVPSGAVVADAGTDGMTNYNVLDNGHLYQELIVVGDNTRVTVPPAQLAAGGAPALEAQGVDSANFVSSLLHAAMATTHTLQLMAQLTGHADASTLAVSLGDVEGDTADLQHSYVLGTAGAQPFGTGVDSWNEGNYDYWTETLVA